MGRVASRKTVYEVIDGERDYQDIHHPVGQPDPLSLGESILLMEDYLAEARRQWRLASQPELESLRSIRKIAAIAVQCMENHGALPRLIDPKL